MSESWQGEGWNVEVTDNGIEAYAAGPHGDYPLDMDRSEALKFGRALMAAATPPYVVEPTEYESGFFQELLNRSSFGTESAKDAMSTVPQSVADEVLRRSRLSGKPYRWPAFGDVPSWLEEEPRPDSP